MRRGMATERATVAHLWSHDRDVSPPLLLDVWFVPLLSAGIGGLLSNPTISWEWIWLLGSGGGVMRATTRFSMD